MNRTLNQPLNNVTHLYELADFPLDAPREVILIPHLRLVQHVVLVSGTNLKS